MKCFFEKIIKFHFIYSIPKKFIKKLLIVIDMPYKLRNNRRHKFKKAHYKITNWPEYNEALKKHGSITI